ncbi:MAG: hypothetical protein LBB38_01370 [Puniceicoccales bacterium]|jgi:hypothetical protein|nr:hypothetical protein [Puniceicoccales bacterium]
MAQMRHVAKSQHGELNFFDKSSLLLLPASRDATQVETKEKCKTYLRMSTAQCVIVVLLTALTFGLYWLAVLIYVAIFKHDQTTVVGSAYALAVASSPKTGKKLAGAKKNLNSQSTVRKPVAGRRSAETPEDVVVTPTVNAGTNVDEKSDSEDSSAEEPPAVVQVSELETVEKPKPPQNNAQPQPLAVAAKIEPVPPQSPAVVTRVVKAPPAPEQPKPPIDVAATHRAAIEKWIGLLVRNGCMTLGGKFGDAILALALEAHGVGRGIAANGEIEKILRANANVIGTPTIKTAAEGDRRLAALKDYLAGNREVREKIIRAAAANICDGLKKVPTDIYAFNGTLVEFSRSAYGMAAWKLSSFDRVICFAADYMKIVFRPIASAQPAAEWIVEEDGSISVDGLRQCMLALAIASDFSTNPEKQQLLVRLQKLYANAGNMMDNLSRVVESGPDDPPRAVEGLAVFKGNPKSTRFLRLSVLDSVIFKPTLQEGATGSCFASATHAALQANDPAKCLKLAVEMICDNGISIKNVHGAEVFVGTNCYESDVDRALPANRENARLAFNHAFDRTLADIISLGGYGGMGKIAADNHGTKIGLRILNAHLKLIDVDLGIRYDLHFSSAAPCVGHRRSEFESRGAYVPRLVIADSSGEKEFGDNASAIRTLDERVAQIKAELENKLRKLDRRTYTDEIDDLNQKIIHCDLTREEIAQLQDGRCDTMDDGFGGWPNYIMEALYGVHCEICEAGANFTSAIEIFEASLKVISEYAGEPARILAVGFGHAYTLVPVFSAPLMAAIGEVRAGKKTISLATQELLEKVRHGERILFVDSGRPDGIGIGIGCLCESREPQLFSRLVRDGCIHDFSLDLNDESYEWLRKLLTFCRLVK